MGVTQAAQPWNKGRLVGQKAPRRVRDIWAIRTPLEVESRWRELALFNLAIDSKLRGCDLVRLRVSDVSHAGEIVPRASVIQQKTRRPVRFEITEESRRTVSYWIDRARLAVADYLFPSGKNRVRHISTRQYARLILRWVAAVGLDAARYGTHSMRRMKPALIYRRTRNLRAVQLLLGHTKLESTVRYLGLEVDDALEIAEQTEI